MRKEKKIRRRIIIGLIGILFLMSVGYAAFATQLNIRGTINVTTEWNVKITDVSVLTTNGSAESVDTSFNDLSASMEADLYNNGDYVEYEITVANTGTIDAKLNSINFNGSTNDAVRISYSGVVENLALFKNSTRTIKVKIEYNPNYSGDASNTSGQATIDLNFVQATGGELPDVPLTPNDLKDLVVTAGDGLYIDEYESGRCLYKGSNPDNYITFNDELWRIMSIETDNTLKIVRAGILEDRTRQVDNSYNRSLANDTYCVNPYYGCNAWAAVDGIFTNGDFSGTVTNDASLNIYLNGEYYDSLTDIAKNQIATHTFSIGGTSYTGIPMATQIAQENAYTWIGKIGLIRSSEFTRANSNIAQCGTGSLHNTNTTICQVSNYLILDSSYWTLTPNPATTYYMFGVYTSGGLLSPNNNNGTLTYYAIGVRPAVYLKPNITLAGTGTQTDPYTIN